MTTKFTEVDLWFTDHGDLAIDNLGDLKDTKNSYARSLFQEIQLRLKSRYGDWKLAPTVGSNLSSFAGMNVSSKVIDLLKKEIARTLTADGLLKQTDFEVLALTLDDGNIIVRIVLKDPATTEDDLYYTLGYDSEHQRFIGY